jgi:hypothetical protein
MMMMLAPPMPMPPATPMNFDYIGGFGTVDRSALSRKRTCSLRSGKQQRGSDADASESFIHRQSFLCFLAANQHVCGTEVPPSKLQLPDQIGNRLCARENLSDGLREKTEWMAKLMVLRRWSVGSDFLRRGRSLSQRLRFRATYFQSALGLVA